MKKNRGKYEKHYGGIFGKKFLYQTEPIYGCGEVVSYEWKNDKKGEIIVKLKYLSSDGTIARNTPIIFTGIKKQREETFKEKMLGKKAPPKLDFEIGDMIVFEGEEKTYDLTYAREKGIEVSTRSADKAIILNQLKAMTNEDAVTYVNKLLDDEKFDSLFYQQQEKKVNGFETKKDLNDTHKNIDDVNKSIKNFSDNKNSMNEKTNNKDNTKNENNKYSNDLDEIDKKIDELQKSFENEINKLNQQKDKVIQKIEKTKNLDKNNKSIENNVNENIQNNEKNIDLERER